MLAEYYSGKSLEDIATALASPERQPYWIRTLGHKYEPSAQVIHKVMARAGCKFREQGVGAGSAHWNWKGGLTIDPEGYVLQHTPGHPNANWGGYVRQHRLVMEAHIGRLLTDEEVVHHEDKNKSNNDISNLILFANNSEHLAYELKGIPPKYLRDKWEREKSTSIQLPVQSPDKA